MKIEIQLSVAFVSGVMMYDTLQLMCLRTSFAEPTFPLSNAASEGSVKLWLEGGPGIARSP